MIGKIRVDRAVRDRRSMLVVGCASLTLVAATAISPVASAAARRSSAPVDCQAPTSGGPVFITATCVDPVLNQPYVDVEKPGSMTDPSTGVTANFTYVHGGFTGTNAKFSFYFPAADRYKGRYFETTYPTLSQEDAQPGCPEVGTSVCSVVFAISNGAYVVSTNNDGGVPAGGALAPYRTNAAAAKYSWTVAEGLYGTTVQPRGYLYGASGGAYQVVGSVENSDGVWDGAVPMVFGAPDAIPSFQAVQLLALRVLVDKLPQIADAMAPGGGGDPYAGLTSEQQSVLHEITSLGFPLRGWWQYQTLEAQPGGSFFALEPAIRGIDPTYVNDFWNTAGYEGSDPSVQAARIQYTTTVSSVTGSPATGLMLANIPPGYLSDADMIIKSGPEAGKTVPISTTSGNALTFGPLADSSVTRQITPGTSVELDNSWAIALGYYPRHQVPSPVEAGWNQYVGRNGQPLEPQRSVVLGPLFAASSGGSAPDGNFHGKMIILESAMDVQAYPWSADWYQQQARAQLGPRFSDDYRLWYMDNADHGPNGPAGATDPTAADHVVAYSGEMQQALLDLDTWTTDGTQPPASSKHSMSSDTQVHLPPTAPQRQGVQPVAALSAEAGGVPSSAGRIDVRAGQPVTFTMVTQTPPGTGRIVNVEWDFEGTGTFGLSTPPTGHCPVVHMSQTHSFTQPGKYFAVVRVTSQADGSVGSPYGLVQNLASVRVVVS